MNTIEIAIRDCKNDNLHSFGPLYDHFIGKIYKFVFHKVSDDATTEDIVSDVFFKALKSVKNFSGTTEQEFSSWLYRIAYNSVIDFYRTKKEYAELESIEETIGQSPDYSNQIDDNKTLDEILCYLETISKDQKDILIMRIWDDLSYKEIAEITGKSVDACKKTVSRLMAQIEANVTFLFFLVSILYK